MALLPCSTDVHASDLEGCSSHWSGVYERNIISVEAGSLVQFYTLSLIEDYQETSLCTGYLLSA
jgi:hypothetical protein